MAETVQGLRVQVYVTGSVNGAAGDGRMPVDFTYDQTFTDGTAAAQVGYIYQKLARSLAGTNETLDLDGETDFQGVAMSGNNNVKLLLLHNNNTTPGVTLTMGGGDFVGPLVDTSDLGRTGANGLILMVNPTDGWPITASTGDGLKIANSTTGTYDIILAGDNS